MVKSSSVGDPEPEKLQKKQSGSNNMGHPVSVYDHHDVGKVLCQPIYTHLHSKL